jgi:ATP-binding cassette subfamily B multidrug efflux pump
VWRGEIRFEKLTFSYGRHDGTPLFEGLNFIIRLGKSFGLVSRSGSGKSTLVNLLLRFSEPERRCFRIDR